MSDKEVESTPLTQTSSSPIEENLLDDIAHESEHLDIMRSPSSVLKPPSNLQDIQSIDTISQLDNDYYDNEEVSEEDDDFEEEPTFKYHRLTSTTTEYLVKDAISCISVSSEYIAIGTHGGKVNILDLEGNLKTTFACHFATINSLSFDAKSSYILSGSDDGTIVINGISNGFKFSKNFMRPIKSVYLSSDYIHTGGNQRFLAAGMSGQVILHEKGWLGFNETILSSGDGPIMSMLGNKSLAAYSTDSGVHLLDLESKKVFSFIDRPPNSPRSDLYPCHFHWKSDDILYIGWADCVKIIHIQLNGSVPKSAEVINIFRTDFVVCGIFSYQGQVVLLGCAEQIIRDDMEEYPSDESVEVETPKGPEPPEIRLVNPDTGESSADILSIHGYEHFQSRNYKLVSHPMSETFYVASPKDLLLAKPRDADDHIDWLLDYERYQDALDLIQGTVPASLQRYTFRQVGRAYMHHLLEERNYIKVAQLCPEMLLDDTELWEQWIFAFSEVGQLEAMVPYIPTRQPQLSSTIYEMILSHFLTTGHYETLFKTIRSWPPNLYGIPTIITAIQDKLDDARDRGSNEDTHVLLGCMAELHLLNDEPQKALDFYLKLKDDRVFPLIEGNNLYKFVQDKVLPLMELDETHYSSPQEYANTSVEETSQLRAAGLLIRNTDTIPVSKVVEQLEQSSPRLLHSYLHGIYLRDYHLASLYHNLQLDLYARFDYNLLKGFLKTSNYYSLQRAYEICKERDFVPELVFILGRMGNQQEALQLIIERLDDVEGAIEFAKEHDDPDLWTHLLKYSADKPLFLKGLLERAGSHISPIRVIQAIPLGLEIPGLKHSIIKILQDFSLQMELRLGCQRVLNRDCTQLRDKLHVYHRQGIYPLSGPHPVADLEDNEFIVECSGCTLPLQVAESEPVVVFLCKHAYHQDCLIPDDLPTAPSYQKLLDNTVQNQSQSLKNTIRTKLDYSLKLQSEFNDYLVCRQCRETGADDSIAMSSIPGDDNKRSAISNWKKWRWAGNTETGNGDDSELQLIDNFVDSTNSKDKSNQSRLQGSGGDDDLPPMVDLKLNL
jgi:WD40 repeat protein